MDNLEQALYSLSAREFEHFLGDLWEDRGWTTQVTPTSNDDGVDIIATRNDHYPQKRLIQAKHIQRGATLSRSNVQQYSYLHRKENVDEVILITTGEFSSGAWESAKVANVKLIDIDGLKTLIRETAAEDRLKEYGYHRVEVEGENEDTGWPEVDENSRTAIQAYAHTEEVYTRLLASLGLEDYPLSIQMGVLLQLFRGPDSIHVLIFMQPGDGTPTLVNRTLEFSRPSTAVDCTRVDAEGLVGRYTSAGEVYPGLLTQYDGGIVALKQLTEYKDYATTLLEPLNEGRISVAVGGFHGSIESEFSALATGRLLREYYTEWEHMWEQVDMNPQIFCAFDYVGLMDSELPHEYSLPSTFTLADGDVSPITETRLRQHIQLASNLEPTIPDDIEETVMEVEEQATEELTNDITPKPVGKSIYSSVAKLAKASARIRLSDEVTVDDVYIAAIGIPDILTTESGIELVDTILLPDDGEDEEREDESTIIDINNDGTENMKAIISEVEAKYEDGAPVEEALDTAVRHGMERSKAEHELEKLRQRGDVYEPTADHLRTV